MPIPIEQKKKFKILASILIGILLITLFNLWQVFFRKPKVGAPSSSQSVFLPKKIDIDWSILEDPVLKNLDLFPKLPEFTGKSGGRDDPFSPYK